MNNVQGTNTKKQDGTGREIITEKHELYFDGDKWTSNVEIIPLEDVDILAGYGFQRIGISTYWTNIRYYGSNNRAVNDGTIDSNCESETCDEICAFVNSDCTGDYLRIGINPVYDLCKRDFVNGASGGFARSYGKMYFMLINTGTFEQGKHYNAQGFFKVGYQPY